jgi:Holliday junction resolvase-like predicted endonuclease
VFDYQSPEIDERKLEDMVRQAPHLIEDGLRFLDQQTSAGRGPLDVLMVDSGNALVVAEIKAHQEDSMLWQALDYYDYVAANVDRFARVYAEAHVDAAQRPRLLLVAASFSQALVNRCRWLDDELRISLFAYRYIKRIGANEETLVFYEVEVPPKQELAEEVTLERVLRYITDETALETARQFLKRVRAWNPEAISIRPRRGYAPIFAHGRKVADFDPRRKHWTIWANVDGSWQRFAVRDTEDLERAASVVRAKLHEAGIDTPGDGETTA